MKKGFNLIFLAYLLFSCSNKNSIFEPSANPFDVYPSRFAQQVLVESFLSESIAASVSNQHLMQEINSSYGGKVFNCNYHKSDWLESPQTNELAYILGGLSTIPRNAVNRTPGSNTIKGDDGFTLLLPDNTDAAVRKALHTEPEVSIAMYSEIVNENTTDLHVYLASPKLLSLPYQVELFITADSVRALFQQGVSGNYFHRDVYVASLMNADWQDTSSLQIHVTPQGYIYHTVFRSITIQGYPLPLLSYTAALIKYDPDFRKMRILNAQRVKPGAKQYWRVN